VARRCWLMKSEPSTFSFDDLLAAPERTTPWDGIRNYQARNFMRDEMRPGDEVLFYHSNAAPPGVVGLAEVASEPYDDPSQFDPILALRRRDEHARGPALAARRRARRAAPRAHGDARGDQGRPRAPRHGGRAARQPVEHHAGRSRAPRPHRCARRRDPTGLKRGASAVPLLDSTHERPPRAHPRPGGRLVHPQRPPRCRRRASPSAWRCRRRRCATSSERSRTRACCNRRTPHRAASRRRSGSDATRRASCRRARCRRPGALGSSSAPRSAGRHAARPARDRGGRPLRLRRPGHATGRGPPARRRDPPLAARQPDAARGGRARERPGATAARPARSRATRRRPRRRGAQPAPVDPAAARGPRRRSLGWRRTPNPSWRARSPPSPPRGPT
jgi:hypothetical protein